MKQTLLQYGSHPNIVGNLWAVEDPTLLHSIARHYSL